MSKEALLKLRKWLEHAKEAEPQCIHSAPGFRLTKFLRLFCTKKIFDDRIGPLHAEYLVAYYMMLMEKQYGEALHLKREMRFFLIWTVFTELRSLLTGRFKT